MNRLWIGFALIAVLGVGADEPKEDERTSAARAFVTALTKGEFEKAAKDFDEAVAKASPPDKTAEFWKSLLAQSGAFVKQGAAKKQTVGKYDVIDITCEFEKGQLVLRVSYDADGKIAGYFVLSAYESPAYVKPNTFTETEVKVTTGEVSLPGTLTLPKGDGPFPAVVLVHGSGPGDRDETIGPNKPFRDLAGGLASRGVAVLRYDKRTLLIAKKQLKMPDNLTLKEETVDDAVSAVELLAKRKEIDKKRIFVVGHSLGAFAAPRIGAAAPDVAGLVLLAGNSRPLEDLIVEQFTYIYSLEKEPEKHKEEMERLKKQIDRIKDPKLSADTPAAELPFGGPASYWLDLRKYDAVGTAAKLTQPMLLLQGERDYQVTMVDYAGWKKALAERKNVRLKSYPKLNHLFMEGEGKAKPAEYDKAGHVAVEVIDDIAEWIKK